MKHRKYRKYDVNWEAKQFYVNRSNRPKGLDFRMKENLSTSTYYAVLVDLCHNHTKEEYYAYQNCSF